MKLTAEKSIALNPPMRRLSLTAGFAALTKAVSFAEEILRKYEKSEEGPGFGETLVFLRNINGELRRAEAVRNEYLLTLRLTVARQLSVTGQIDSRAIGREYPAAAERLIERMSTDLRSYDRSSWEKLTELRRLIESGEALEAVSSRTVVTEQGEPQLLRVDAASLIRTVYESHESEAPELRSAAVLQLPAETLLFRTNIRCPADAAAPAVTAPETHSFTETSHQTAVTEQNTTLTREGDNVTVGNEINVSSADYNYNTESLIHRDETSTTTETTEQNTTLTREGDNVTVGNEINVSSSDYNYNSESLIHRDETSTTTETTEQNTTLTREGDNITVGNEINVSSADYNYNSESLIHKEETSTTTEATQQNTTLTREGDNVTTGNEINVSSADYNYTTESLIHKEETSSTTETTEQNTTLTREGDNVTVGNEINVSSADYNYNTESLIHKDETSTTTETTQQNITLTREDDNVTVGNEINVSSADYNYTTESLIHKDETSTTTEATEQNTTLTREGDNITVGNEINVSSADYNYNTESLIHKDETSSTTETTEQNTTLTREGDNVTVGNEINVSSADYNYTTESLIHRDEAVPADGAAAATMVLNSFITAAARHFAGLAVRETAALPGTSFIAPAGMKLNTSARAVAERRELIRSLSLLQEAGERSTEEYNTQTLRVLREQNDTGPVSETEKLRESVKETERELLSRMAERTVRRTEAAEKSAAAEPEKALPGLRPETLRLLTELIRGREVSSRFEHTSGRDIAVLESRAPGSTAPASGSVTDSIYRRSELMLRLRYQTGGLGARSISTFSQQREAARAAFGRAAGYTPRLSAGYASGGYSASEAPGLTFFLRGGEVPDRALEQAAPGYAPAHPENRISPAMPEMIRYLRETSASEAARSSISEAFRSFVYGEVRDTLSPDAERRQREKSSPLQPVTAESISVTAQYENVSYPVFAEYSYGNTVQTFRDQAVMLPGAVIRNMSVIPSRGVLGGSHPAENGAAPRQTAISAGQEAYAGTASPLSLLEPPRGGNAGNQSGSAPQSPRIAAPSSDMLIRQYGNLIDGADPTGRTLDLGTAYGQQQDSGKAISELTAAVKSAAERTAENSRLIDELRNKQKEIENGALKASDMRVISDEVITRLRSELRLDRSRYSG